MALTYEEYEYINVKSHKKGTWCSGGGDTCKQAKCLKHISLHSCKEKHRDMRIATEKS